TLTAGVGLLGAFALPISAVAAVLAPELIVVMMGARWVQVTSAFQLLAIGIFPRLAVVPLNATMRGLRKQRTLLKTQWVYVGMVAGGAWIGTRWGIDGVAAGVAIALIASFVILSIATASAVQTHVSQLWRPLPSSVAVAAVAAALAHLGTVAVGDAGALVTLIVGGGLGAAAMAAGLLLPGRRRDLRFFLRRRGRRGAVA
ncbi:MAG: polysaccharide biosynthesis C-terminal domain-containing protein, partial [Planctomycetes bacterium]|nr:polysaccharide biosynthesis C-terminal domain-containing protein [Planctomycetota bacterium]